MESQPDTVKHLRHFEAKILELLRSQVIRFDAGCRSALPASHGIYRIFEVNMPTETIRAGRTITAAGGLQQRVYQNHLMGSQPGNLQAQLVAEERCTDLEAAKRYIRENLAVQVQVVEDPEERKWLEHFMLGVLQPQYCG